MCFNKLIKLSPPWLLFNRDICRRPMGIWWSMWINMSYCSTHGPATATGQWISTVKQHAHTYYLLCISRDPFAFVSFCPMCDPKHKPNYEDRLQECIRLEAIIITEGIIWVISLRKLNLTLEFGYMVLLAFWGFPIAYITEHSWLHHIQRENNFVMHPLGLCRCPFIELAEIKVRTNKVVHAGLFILSFAGL